MKTVNLYTRQHVNSLHELNNKGRITNKEIYIKLHMRDISDFFLEKYSTFTTMASKFVPCPDDVEYPLWCSVSKKNCLKPIENEVVYCLEVPIDQVVYFDGLKWDYVLNNLYIEKNSEDKLTFEKTITKFGINNTYSLFNNDPKYIEVEKVIRDSWYRIFEISDWNEFIVQANIWEIRKEWIKHIIKPGEDLFKIAKDMQETFPPKHKL